MLIRNGLVYAPEGGATGGGEGEDKTPPATTFSADYVRELRAENASWRTKAQTHATEAATAKQAAEAAATEAAAKIEAATKEATTKATETVTAAEAKANARVIRSELKAGAAKAGMVDMDALKMLDMSTLKLNADGEVEGVDALLEATKKAKPYLFGAQSTSSSKTPPDKKGGETKNAKEMTDAEFETARKAHAWRA